MSPSDKDQQQGLGYLTMTDRSSTRPDDRLFRHSVPYVNTVPVVVCVSRAAIRYRSEPSVPFAASLSNRGRLSFSRVAF